MRILTVFSLLLSVVTLASAAEEPSRDGAITLSYPSATPPHLPPLEGKRDKIWSGVIVATEVASPKPPPAELREFAKRLNRIFGYNQFALVGSATEEIDELDENWLVPNTLFSLNVKARRAVSKEARGGYLLNLEIYQEKHQLLDIEAKLAPGSPLFIRGPQYGKGQVILVLQVVR